MEATGQFKKNMEDAGPTSLIKTLENRQKFKSFSLLSKTTRNGHKQETSRNPLQAIQIINCTQIS